MKAPLISLNRYRHHGLALLRVGIGLTFIVHGIQKLVGGQEAWAGVGGGVMSVLGVEGGHALFGVIAALFEAVGGLLLVLGLFTRFACIAIALVMVGALVHHFSAGDPYGVWSHPVKVLFAVGGLFLTGPGRFSLDHVLTDRDILESARPAEHSTRRVPPAWATREKDRPWAERDSNGTSTNQRTRR
jgi:putative oxidoreductase